MELIWPGKGRKVGDTVTYRCLKGGYIGSISVNGWDTVITGMDGLTVQFIHIDAVKSS